MSGSLTLPVHGVTPSWQDPFAKPSQALTTEAPSPFGVVGHGRERAALIAYATRQLEDLARQQRTKDDHDRYATMLSLVEELVSDGVPTPQVSDNGEGGILIEWVAGGHLLRADYESAAEILVTATDSRGVVQFEEILRAGEIKGSAVTLRGQAFLHSLRPLVRRPVPLH